MGRSQVPTHEGFQPVSAPLLGGLHFVHPSLPASGLSVDDRFTNEIVLRPEMGIEAAMSETRIGHQAGQAGGFNPLSAKPRRGCVHHTLSRLLSVALFVPHARTSSLPIALYYMHHIICQLSCDGAFGV